MSLIEQQPPINFLAPVDLGFDEAPPTVINLTGALPKPRAITEIPEPLMIFTDDEAAYIAARAAKLTRDSDAIELSALVLTAGILPTSGNVPSNATINLELAQPVTA